jgi:PAS domain S-box-containing protein
VDRQLADQPPARTSDPDYRLIFDDAPTGMLLTSLQEPTFGHVVRANRALCDLVGHTEAELCRSGLSLITHPDDDPESLLLAERMTSGEFSRREVRRRFLRADGDEIWAAVSIATARDSGGGPTWAVYEIREAPSRKDRGVESQAAFWGLASNINVGMVLRQVDPPRFLYVNGPYLEMFGWDTRAELPSITEITDRIHPEDRPIVRQVVAATPATGTAETEFRAIHPNGEQRWLWMRATPLADSDGVVRRIAAVVEDITASKRASAALQHTQQLFQQLASGLDVGFALRQLHPPEVLYANPAYLTIFGFDGGGPIPTVAEISARVDPADAARGWRALEVNLMGQAVEQEVRVIHPDGGLRLIRVDVRPIIDADGQIRRVTTHVQDITERRAAEMEVREARARFDQLARTTEVGFLLRAGTEVLYRSAGLGRILGHDTLEPGAKVPNFSTQIHPADRERGAAVGDRAKRGESSSAELRIIRPNGEVRWISIKNEPVVQASGEPSRVATTVIDITDRKVAEEALVAAKEQAEHANSAKDQFLSRMSHELRTPLNAILGFGQLLEIDHLTPEQHDSVERLVAAGEHLLGLIDEVLDIVTVERGHMRLSLEPVRIRDVTDEAVGMLHPLVQRSGVQISVDERALDAQVYVRADRQRLRQVLVNLLANAVQYNHVGGSVRVGAEPTDPGRYRLLVTDTGIGIADADVDRLFQPFEQLADDRSSVEGTGLGLAVTRALMTAMAGTVGVNSRIGEGSTFWIDLPIADAPSDGSDDKPQASRTPALAVAAVGRVLYIEDNLSNVALMERVLARRPGIRLDVATQGRDGLDMALTYQPDLVLLDLHLPDIPGTEVLRNLRANSRTADTPVVVLSADATPGQRERLLALGATQYLTKPIDIRGLLAIIDNLGVASRPGDRSKLASSAVESTRRISGAASDDSPRRVETEAPEGLLSFVHDLNNLLGVILTYCALLDSEATEAEMASDIGTIRQSAQAAVALARQLVSPT